jgi:hypothetical protein
MVPESAGVEIPDESRVAVAAQRRRKPRAMGRVAIRGQRCLGVGRRRVRRNEPTIADDAGERPGADADRLE